MHGDHNAGGEATLEAARLAARARAQFTRRPVGIYLHVGGQRPDAKTGGRLVTVPARGDYQWRDLTDVNGQPLGTPKWVYREVEVVQP